MGLIQYVIYFWVFYAAKTFREYSGPIVNNPEPSIVARRKTVRVTPRTDLLQEPKACFAKTSASSFPVGANSTTPRLVKLVAFRQELKEFPDEF